MKKLLAMILSVAMLAALGITAMAVETSVIKTAKAGDVTIYKEFTVVPFAGGPTITMTDVAVKYKRDDGKNIPDTTTYTFFLADSGTVTFTGDIENATLVHMKYKEDFADLSDSWHEDAAVETTYAIKGYDSLDLMQFDTSKVWFVFYNVDSSYFMITTYLAEIYLSADKDLTDIDVENVLVAGASDWAIAELKAADAAGLVPASFVGNWQKPTDRIAAAAATVQLFEKATGKTAAQIAAEKGWVLEPQPFDDTNDQNVAFLKAAGITTGVGGGKYGTGGFTRVQEVVMLGRGFESILGVTITGSHKFTDVPDWGDKYIGWAVENGITNGVSATQFDSNGELKNEHTVVFNNRALKAALKK